MTTEYTPCGKARHFNVAGAGSTADGTVKFSEVVGCWKSVPETAVSVSAVLPSLPLASLWLSLSLELSVPISIVRITDFVLCRRVIRTSYHRSTIERETTRERDYL